MLPSTTSSCLLRSSFVQSSSFVLLKKDGDDPRLLFPLIQEFGNVECALNGLRKIDVNIVVLSDEGRLVGRRPQNVYPRMLKISLFPPFLFVGVGCTEARSNSVQRQVGKAKRQ